MNNFKKILLFSCLFFVTKHEVLAHNVIPAVNLSSPALAKGWVLFLLEHAGEAVVYGGIAVGAVYLAKQVLKQQQSRRPDSSVFNGGRGMPFGVSPDPWRQKYLECNKLLCGAPLSKRESEKISRLFVQRVPMTNWSKIDWSKIEQKKLLGIQLAKLYQHWKNCCSGLLIKRFI